MAFVVFPTASNASVVVRTLSGSSDISAIPPALSVTGPYASKATTIPVKASIDVTAITASGDILLDEDQRIFFEADKNTYIESHASDTFRAVVKGIIRGAKTVRINPTGVDTYETVLEIDKASSLAT